MLLWSLCISLVPLAIISYVNYGSARDGLHAAATERLRQTAKLQAKGIEERFAERRADVDLWSRRQSMARFLEKLNAAFETSGTSPGEFVNSHPWALLDDEFGADLEAAVARHDVYDALLADASGNVLFTALQEPDLGANIIEGMSSGTALARACRKTLADGSVGFADFERYEPSEDRVAAFWTSRIVDASGEPLGLLVVQIRPEWIHETTDRRFSESLTAETYLIGTDLRIRSCYDIRDDPTLFGRPAENELTRLWLEGVGLSGKETACPDLALQYDGRQGYRVLGARHTIHIADAHWGMISEIAEDEAFAPAARQARLALVLLLATAICVLLITVSAVRRIVRPILELSAAARRVAVGQLDQDVGFTAAVRNEIGELATSFGHMLANLRNKTEETERQNWLKSGHAELNDRMRGVLTVADLGRDVITYLAEYLGAQIGAFYIADVAGQLQLVGSYAYKTRKHVANRVAPGEGLVGQAALEGKSILLTQVPEDYIAISSGLGEAPPRNILVMPLLHENETKAVLELGSFEEFSPRARDFLTLGAESIAIAIHTAQSRQRVQELLEETQAQAEELEAQQEELKQSNEELEAQARALKASEEALRVQQEELQQTNEELEERTEALESERISVARKNADLEATQQMLEEKAEQLGLASKYKSEFLANMSHELRTPLNSLLLLSRLLAENTEGTLTEKQIEFARTINSSGGDLLNLINEILDLAKIEAGHMELLVEDVHLGDFLKDLTDRFCHVAAEKGLEFRTELAEELPTHIRTDEQRLGQILKNLISNAFKFAEEGHVSVSIERAGHTAGELPVAPEAERTIAFAVTDTGIGVPGAQQKVIFEAFQQGDGAIDRKYGGTGLGLTISREMARLLGGKIRVESEEGRGSRFILLLPEALPQEGVAPDERQRAIAAGGQPRGAVAARQVGTASLTLVSASPGARTDSPSAEGESRASAVASAPSVRTVPDDRGQLQPGERSVLIIEHDRTFASLLVDLAHKRGFKCLVAGDGESGIKLAGHYVPTAILLDIGLPGIDGLGVMNRLKETLQTRHIPVQVISGQDRQAEAQKLGTVGYLRKPAAMEQIAAAFRQIESLVSRSLRRLLVVGGDEESRRTLMELIGGDDVGITVAGSGADALARLTREQYDCIVLDMALADMSGIDLLKQIKTSESHTAVPVIALTSADLSSEERLALDRYAERTVVKGTHSAERLLDETALFLHRGEHDLPEEQRRVIQTLHDREAIFKDKKILIVDDDMRNVFALSAVLEEKGLQPLVAQDGRKALEFLGRTPDVHLVLMDIMMPEMDGYETIRRIRKEERFRELPIIALTAKAMQSDRAKCIAAGANDYVTKPVDTDKLLSLLRVWLYGQGPSRGGHVTDAEI